MESNNELKEIDINWYCTCYYFDDIIRVRYFGFDNILLDKDLWHLKQNFYGCKSTVY